MMARGRSPRKPMPCGQLVHVAAGRDSLTSAASTTTPCTAWIMFSAWGKQDQTPAWGTVAAHWLQVLWHSGRLKTVQRCPAGVLGDTQRNLGQIGERLRVAAWFSLAMGRIDYCTPRIAAKWN